MQTPVLDQDVIASLRELQDMGEPDLIGELIELFVEDMPPRITELRGAIAANDLRAIARAAHTCKGSSANLGASALAAACGELEAAAKAQTPAKFAPLLVEIEDAFALTVRALREEWPEAVR